MAAAFLTQALLEKVVDPAKVRQLCDDALTGSTAGAAPQAVLDQCMVAAEGLYFARMLKSYDRAAATALALADEAILQHAAFVALELLSERRTEFCSPEGWGAFRAQYERAMEHFKLVAAASLRSKGEESAGINPQVGGAISPSPPAATSEAFVFAPSKYRPGGAGGF